MASAQDTPPTFIEPTKRITNPQELAAFHKSPTYKAIFGFIQHLGEIAHGKSNSCPCHISPATEGIIAILEELGTVWTKEIPPIPQPMRYGNKAYRIWHKRLLENITQLHDRILPENLKGGVASVELGPYLLDAFGNSTRLDYGTGHELHFVAWTYCLRSIGVLTSEDELAIVTKIFPAYLNTARGLQRAYGLEPAGSHGVWSLDDYQFIPFIWGAAQLVDNPTIPPLDGIKRNVAAQYADEFMYLGCINFIFTMKKGPFHEHSRDLYNISAAASWAKIYQGMLRKFADDVLSKVPIMQHFLFGSILPFKV